VAPSPWQAIQWLRHGCLPVIVVEGRPPLEKQGAQRARYAARNGHAGGGSGAGASSFERLGRTVGQLLEHLVGVFLCVEGEGREAEVRAAWCGVRRPLFPFLCGFISWAAL
jgi:flap endonuclease GEN